MQSHGKDIKNGLDINTHAAVIVSYLMRCSVFHKLLTAYLAIGNFWQILGLNFSILSRPLSTVFIENANQ